MACLFSLSGSIAPTFHLRSLSSEPASWPRFRRGRLLHRSSLSSPRAFATGSLGCVWPFTGSFAGLRRFRLPSSRSRSNRQHPRALLTQAAQLLQAIGLPHRHLEPQAEHLLRRIPQLLGQLDRIQARVLFPRSPSSRYSAVLPRHELGRQADFAAARRIASSATFRLTPSISNRILPGRITPPTAPARPCLFPYGFQPASW